MRSLVDVAAKRSRNVSSRRPGAGAASFWEPGVLRARRVRLQLPSARLLALADLERSAQMRRRRAGISLELLRPGSDGALREQLCLGFPPAHADRDLGRADTAAGAVGEEALDAPVLQRVEGDRAEAATDRQDL